MPARQFRAPKLISKRARQEGNEHHKGMRGLGLSRLPVNFHRSVARYKVPEIARKFAIVEAFSGIGVRDKTKRMRVIKLVEKMELPAARDPIRMQELTLNLAEELGPADARSFITLYERFKYLMAQAALLELKKE